MIPSDRAVTGHDLDDVRLSYGLSVDFARHLFCMSEAKWSEVVRKNGDEPIRDVTLALIVRLLDYNRWLFEPPRYPEPEEMRELFEKSCGARVSQKQLSVLLGADGSSAHRWLKDGSRQSPSVQVLMHFLEKAFLAVDESERASAYRAWEDIVREEGFARTGEDVLKTGKWTPLREDGDK